MFLSINFQCIVCIFRSENIELCAIVPWDVFELSSVLFSANCRTSDRTAVYHSLR